MALSVIKIGRQKSLATLAKAAFKLDDADAAQRAQAEAALVAANPQLAHEAGFKSGVEIVVPPVRGLDSAGSSRAADKSGVSVQELAHERTETLSKAADAALSGEIKSAKADLKELDGEGVKKLLGSRPDLSKQIDTIRKAAQADIKSLELTRKMVGPVFERLLSDLAGGLGKTGIGR